MEKEQSEVINTDLLKMEYKGILIFILPYFTVCGSLYHIAYWNTFNVNGLAYIGIQDLIQSFIYPFLSFFILVPISMAIGYIILEKTKIFPTGGGRNSKVGKKLNTSISLYILFVLWAVMMVLIYKSPDVKSKWLLFGFIGGFAPAIILDRIGVLNKIIPDSSLRVNIIRIIVYIPLFSFTSGKYYSDLIYKNIKYQYVVNVNTALKSDTLKLVGMTNSYIFFSDLNNANQILIRTEKIDTLRLQEFKSY